MSSNQPQYIKDDTKFMSKKVIKDFYSDCEHNKTGSPQCGNVPEIKSNYKWDIPKLKKLAQKVLENESIPNKIKCKDCGKEYPEGEMVLLKDNWQNNFKIIGFYCKECIKKI